MGSKKVFRDLENVVNVNENCSGRDDWIWMDMKGKVIIYIN